MTHIRDTNEAWTFNGKKLGSYIDHEGTSGSSDSETAPIADPDQSVKSLSPLPRFGRSWLPMRKIPFVFLTESQVLTWLKQIDPAATLPKSEIIKAASRRFDIHPKDLLAWYEVDKARVTWHNYNHTNIKIFPHKWPVARMVKLKKKRQRTTGRKC